VSKRITKDKIDELSEKFEGGLPDYLLDLFDEQELERIAQAKKQKEVDYDNTFPSKGALVSAKHAKFWKKNEAEIVKHKRTVPSAYEYHYKEPSQAEERIKESGVSAEDVIVACATRLDAFAKYYFPHYLKKPSSPFHAFLYDLLGKEIGNSMKWAIAAPRGSAKSSLVSLILPLWCIAYNKKKFIVILSNTAGQAEGFLSDIKRELETNAPLRRDFPYACDKGKVWRANEIVTLNDIKLVALGSGNEIRSRRFTTNRPDLVVLDDIEDSEGVKSIVQRTFLRDQWFNKDVLYAGQDDTDFLFIGTILGKYALLTAVMKEYPDWKSQVFRAVKEFSVSPLWDKWTEIYQNRFDVDRQNTALQFFEDNKVEMLEGTEVLWPEGQPYYQLMVDRLRDPHGFVTEKQNEETDPGNVLLPFDKLHWEDFRDPRMQDLIKRGVTFGGLDPSLGKTKTSDHSVIVTVVRDTQTGYLLVVDINIKRRDTDEQIDAILDLQRNDYKYKLFVVEENAFQYVVEQALRKKSREAGVYVPIKGITQYRDKVLRIESLIPFVFDGTIIFDKHKYDTNLMYNLGIEQITTYTGIGTAEPDDTPDCLSMVVDVAKKPRFKLIYKENRRRR